MKVEPGQEAFSNGYDAFQDDVGLIMSPYKTNTYDWDAWRNGWFFALEESRGEWD